MKGKKVTMSNQFENETQPTMTPEEERQRLLSEMDASQQAIAELSDEELEAVAGGAALNPNHPLTRVLNGLGHVSNGLGHVKNGLGRLRR